MTPAERQRRCRENGKGRHRGRRGPIKAQREQARVEVAALLAAAEAEEAALAAAAAGAYPVAASPAAPTIAAPAERVAAPGLAWNLSVMAA